MHILYYQNMFLRYNNVSIIRRWTILKVSNRLIMHFLRQIVFLNIISTFPLLAVYSVWPAIRIFNQSVYLVCMFLLVILFCPVYHFASPCVTQCCANPCEAMISPSWRQHSPDDGPHCKRCLVIELTLDRVEMPSGRQVLAWCPSGGTNCLTWINYTVLGGDTRLGEGQRCLHNDHHANKHHTITHCWFDVGPASATLAQHQTRSGWTCGFRRDCSGNLT